MENLALDLIEDIPPITRCWTAGMFLALALEYCGYLSGTDLLFSYEAIVTKGQYWRLVTSFFYFKRMSWDLPFSLYFVARTSKSLEEGMNDMFGYLWLIVVNAVMLLMISAFIHPIYWLGPSLDEVLIYIWARSNYNLPMEMFGLVTFNAGYLPYMYAVITHIADDKPLVGVVLALLPGHLYFYFLEVFPRVRKFNPLLPPWRWRL